MASPLNDRVCAYTSSGPVNLYSGNCYGTASDKALAAAMGGHSYNFLSLASEKYFPNLRTSNHYIDERNCATGHWWGRRRHLSLPPTGESAAECLTSDERLGETDKLKEERRRQRVVAQMTHGDFRGYQQAVGGTVKSSRRTRSEDPSWEGYLLRVNGGVHHSLERLPLIDGFVTKGNNQFSSICKLTRGDVFYKRPKLGANIPSVTYNTLNNHVRSFIY